MMTEPVFNVGDMITPIYTSGYHLTMEKVYVVVSYDPPLPKPDETWPAYVKIHDDRGVLVSAFARRFRFA